jgi:hypothetical protein
MKPSKRVQKRNKKHPLTTEPQVRCYTRALKNARHLQKVAPDLFAKDPSMEGFGTGVPVEILRGLHRVRHDSPILSRYQAVAETLRKHPLPPLMQPARDALFQGTVHFAQLTFHTSSGDKVMSTSDMNQIVQYATHAVVPISEYAAQYGSNAVNVAATLLTKTVNVPSSIFTDNDLQGWVNALKNDNNLPDNSCVFVVTPAGTGAHNVFANIGYHGKADIPYIVAGAWGTGLTLADVLDQYAMAVSHEIAEMVVDPNLGGGNPEVCDPCDTNCTNLNREFFDAQDNFLGSDRFLAPGFNYAYYICAIVKPAGVSDCPASSANCNYGPRSAILTGTVVEAAPIWNPDPMADVPLGGAKIRISPLLVGSSDGFDGSYIISGIPYGQHLVTVSAPRHVTQQVLVQISADQTVMDFSLYREGYKPPPHPE